MRRIARQFTYPTAIAVAAVLLAFVVVASPSPSRAASQEPGLATAGRVSKVDRVEVRIQELQTKLKITPAQKDQWSKVTQAMRDDAKTMEALIKARSEKTGTITAIDDLKSYAAIAEAHADGLKKFIVVFEPFYASMSDAQKKDADTLFQHHGRHGHHGRTKAKAK